jgi:hypothetical protein
MNIIISLFLFLGVAFCNNPPVITVPYSSVNAISKTVEITGIYVSDPDFPTNVEMTLTGTMMNVWLDPAYTTGVTFTLGDGNGNYQVKFNGSLTAVNSALQEVTMVGFQLFTGGDLLIEVSDLHPTTPLTDVEGIQIKVEQGEIGYGILEGPGPIFDMKGASGFYLICPGLLLARLDLPSYDLKNITHTVCFKYELKMLEQMKLYGTEEYRRVESNVYTPKKPNYSNERVYIPRSGILEQSVSTSEDFTLVIQKRGAQNYRIESELEQEFGIDERLDYYIVDNKIVADVQASVYFKTGLEKFYPVAASLDKRIFTRYDMSFPDLADNYYHFSPPPYDHGIGIEFDFVSPEQGEYNFLLGNQVTGGYHVDPNVYLHSLDEIGTYDIKMVLNMPLPASYGWTYKTIKF